MRINKRVAKRFVVNKSSQALESASWMAKTQFKVIFTALATAMAHKLLQKAVDKYPKLNFLDQKDLKAS